MDSLDHGHQIVDHDHMKFLVIYPHGFSVTHVQMALNGSLNIASLRSYTMPTLGLVVGLGPEGESLLMKKVYLFQNLLLPIRLLVLLIITLMVVTYCSFVSAYKTRTPIKMETLPLVWSIYWS